jgi:carboxymethylenebutenolidase
MAEDLIFDPVKTASLAILARKNTEGIPTAIYDHPGTTHGFACRPEVKIPIIAAAFEKAMEQKVNWFNAHL